MRILLQFPEGLKREALKYAEKYESEGHDVFIASAPCYGGCDLPLEEARWIKAAKIIHFGHAKFVKKKLPIKVKVEYVEYYVDVNLTNLANSLSTLSQYKTIALATTIQHTDQLGALCKFYEKNGKKVLTSKGSVAVREAQILGCDSLAVSKVEKGADAIVIIADGMFHPLAVDSSKPVFVVHPQTGQTKQINAEIEKLKKKRNAAVI